MLCLPRLWYQARGRKRMTEEYRSVPSASISITSVTGTAAECLRLQVRMYTSAAQNGNIKADAQGECCRPRAPNCGAQAHHCGRMQMAR